MKSIYIFFLTFFLAASVAAQQPLSLAEAIGRALENNYDMRIVRENQQIAEISNSWGAAGRYPYISMSAGSDNAANFNQQENYVQNRFSGGASLSWTLFEGFSVRINKQRFEELERLSRQNTATMVEGTIQSVILAYYNVLLEKETLGVYEEVMNLSADRYDRSLQFRDFGTAVTYDVLQAQNAYLADKTDYMIQEASYKNALRDLNYLMGEDAAASYELTGEFIAITEEYILDTLMFQMFSNNKSLQNQYINQRLLENAIADARSAYFPRLGFTGGVSGTETRSDYAERGKSRAGSANFYGNFTLSINLFSGGNRNRAVQIARIDEQVGQVKIDEMKHDLTNQLTNLYEFYMVRKELLTVADENLAAARLNLQISQEKFEAGAINSFNFRDVQNIYLDANRRKLDAIYNFIDVHTALLRMTGAIIQEYSTQE